MRIAMMAMTTSNSINVNAGRLLPLRHAGREDAMEPTPNNEENEADADTDRAMIYRTVKGLRAIEFPTDLAVLPEQSVHKSFERCTMLAGAPGRLRLSGTATRGRS